MAVKARQQYYADETSLKKEAREFGMLDALKDKLDSVEYGAQVNIIEEVQENGVPLEIVDKSVNVLVPEVIDNLYTVDPDNSLSAKQGKILYDMIKNLLARGRFLSTWNTATGLPITNPTELPYEYKAGDYYIVSVVAAEGGTNFRPEPDEYDGTASNTQETQEVHITDIYVYDGENWLLLINSTREIAVDDYIDYSFESTNPVENQAIAREFTTKQNKFYTVAANAPSNPSEGDEWYDSTNDKVFYWDGTQWKEMGGGSEYTAGLHISIDANDNNKISVVEWNATSSALGLVKLGSDTRQTTSPNSVSSTANRTYRIQTNNSGQLMVNVPWTDNDTKYTAGDGISIDTSNNNRISCTVKPVYVGATAPSNPGTGDLWYDTTKNTMFLYKNNSWTIIGPEIYPITKNDYDLLTPAEQADGRFFLITDNDGTIYVDWENIENRLVYAGTTAPTSPCEGYIWYDTANDLLKVYDGTQWNEVGGGGVTYTAGDGIDIDANNEISVDVTDIIGTGLTEDGNNNIEIDTTVVATQTDLTSKQDVFHTTSSTAPSNPSEGDEWYDTTNDVLKVYDGTNWIITGKTYTAGTNIDITNDVISADTQFVVVDTLPSASTADKNKVYILGPIGTGADKYEEYIVTESCTGAFESESTITHEYITYTDSDTELFYNPNITNKYLGINNFETDYTQSGYGLIGIGDYGDSTSTERITIDTVMPYIYCNTADDNKLIENPYIFTDTSNNGSFDLYYSDSELSWNPVAACVNQWTKIGETSPDLSGKQDKATSGSGAPSTTPSYIGQMYVDTTNDNLYVATGTSSSSDWTAVDTNTTYTAGDGIDIDANNEISVDVTDIIGTGLSEDNSNNIIVDTTVVATQTDLSGKQDKATSGSTAPSTTPTYVGQMYVDTTNDDLYVATGTSSSSDWTAVDTNTTYTAGDRITITNNEISADKQFEVVSTLPLVGQASEDKVYILGPLNVDGADKYEEWIVTEVTTPGHFESASTVTKTTISHTRDGVGEGSYSWNFAGDVGITNSYIGFNNLTYEGGLSYLECMDTYNSEPVYKLLEVTLPYVCSYEERGEPVQDDMEYPAVFAYGETAYSFSIDAYTSASELTWVPASTTKIWTKIGEHSYSAGTGLTLSGTTFSADTTVLATKADLANVGSYIVVDTLPTVGTADTKKIYLLGPIGTGADKYEEWIITEQANAQTFTENNDIYYTPNSLTLSGQTTLTVTNTTATGDSPGFTLDTNNRQTVYCYLEDNHQGFSNDGWYSRDANDAIWTFVDATSVTVPAGTYNTTAGGGAVSFDSITISTGTEKQWTKIGETSVDLSDLNTKTFYISSSSDLTTAQAAYDWYRAGKNPILRYSGKPYIFGYESNGGVYLSFINMDTPTYYTSTSFGASSIKVKSNLLIHQTGGTVDSVALGSSGTSGDDFRVLLTGVNYQNPYTPEYNGSPTTKKYVDDRDTYIGTSAPTSNLVEGRLWYDTTNDVLKVYDGTNWNTTVDISGKQDKATSGSTAPSTTPSYVGQQYIDTTANKMYVATGTSSSSDWTEVGAGSGDMLYADFNWTTKTGASITLDLNSEIEPSANFTVNAPATIKDGQIYVLRVTTGATAYTMTLGTNVTNPYEEDLTLTANTIAQFSFVGIDNKLELQPSIEAVDMSNYLAKNNTTSYTPSGDYNPATKKYVDDNKGKNDIVESTTAPSDNTVLWIKVDGQGMDTPELYYYNYHCADWVKIVGYYSGNSAPYDETLIWYDTSNYQTKIYNNDRAEWVEIVGYYRGSSSPNDSGLLWYDTTNHILKVYDNANVTWVPLIQDISGKQDKATSGSTAPSTTPSYIGQQYVDTTNNTLYVATGTSSSSDWTEVGAGSGDMLYADYNWVTKTGATITLDLNSTITPSANFTVNAPVTIKDGQVYVLRVSNGATAYTMTLGTGITNPYSVSTTLTANYIDQFVFLAVGGSLELLPATDVDLSGYATTSAMNTALAGKQDKATSGSTAPSTTPSYVGQQYVDTATGTLYVATGTSSSSDWKPVGGGNVIAMTQQEYNLLSTAEKNDGKLRIITDAPTEDISVDWDNVANKKVDISTQTGALSNVKIWVGTQTAYDNLNSYDANTLYFTTNVVSP